MRRLATIFLVFSNNPLNALRNIYKFLFQRVGLGFGVFGKSNAHNFPPKFLISWYCFDMKLLNSRLCALIPMISI
jgi:hypothetical protein